MDARIVGALAVAGVAIAVAGVGIATRGGDERTAVVEPRPTRTAVVHGAFLIEDDAAPHSTFDSSDREISGEVRRERSAGALMASGLVPEVPYLPGALVSRDLIAHADDVGPFEVRTAFVYVHAAGETRSIEILRWRPEPPVRVARLDEDARLVLETGYVGDEPAIIIRPRIADDEPGVFEIWWFDGTILNQLQGAGTLSELLRVAESIARHEG